MNICDVCVYGHLTVDRIFDDFRESTTLGAIANFWHTLTKLDINLNIKLNPIALGEAIILINRKNSQRIGRGNLNIKTRIPNIVQSKWHHIMYLNQLPDLSFIDNIKTGIISADVTAGNMNNILPHLNKIDYLFISDEDLFMNINELGKKVKGSVILHYPSGSFVTNGKKFFEKKIETIENLDVLGAGDIFAACFISSCIKTKNIESAIDFAHKKTTDILLDRNKK